VTVATQADHAVRRLGAASVTIIPAGHRARTSQFWRDKATLLFTGSGTYLRYCVMICTTV
jgi:hypothetical protein